MLDEGMCNIFELLGICFEQTVYSYKGLLSCVGAQRCEVVLARAVHDADAEDILDGVLKEACHIVVVCKHMAVVCDCCIHAESRGCALEESCGFL